MDEIKTNNKEVCQQLITFAKELLNDNNYNVDDITRILYGTNTNNEEVTRQQIAYAKELLQGKNYDIKDIVRILWNTISNNKEVYQQQIAFAKELLQDKNYSTNDIGRILYNTKTCNEQITQQQITFAKELLKDKGYSASDIGEILYGTNTNNEEIYQQQITFAKELLKDKNYSVDDTSRILRETINDNKEIYQQLIALTKELLRNENYNADDITNILYGTRTNNKKIRQQQITLAKELVEKKSYSANDITNILYATDIDDEEMYQQQIAFAIELLKDNNYNAGDLAEILSVTKNYNKQIDQQLIILAKELIQNKKYNINDVTGILSSTRNYTNEQITLQLIAFAKELTQDNSCSANDIIGILSAAQAFNDEQIVQQQIAFAKELLQDKNYSAKDTAEILRIAKGKDKEIYQQQISFTKELLKNENYSIEDIARILSSTQTYNDKGTTQQLIALVKELAKNESCSADDIIIILFATKAFYKETTQQLAILGKELAMDKNYNAKDIAKILQRAHANNKEVAQLQIAFVKELTQDKNYSTDDIVKILNITKSGSEQTPRELIAFTKELLRNENYNVDDITNILYGTKNNNKEILYQQIVFAKELIQDKSYNASDIGRILFATKSDSEQTTRELIAFAKELLKDKNRNAGDIAEILSAIDNTDKEVYQQQITFAKELLEDEYNTNDIVNILNSLYSSYSEDILLNIKNAKKILATVNENDGLTKSQATAIIVSKDKVSYQDVKKLQHKIGRKNIAKLSGTETIIACKLIGLYNAKDINQIPLIDKKEVIRNLVECNNGCFEISDNLRQFFPLIPTTQEEYCALLPALVKAVGIETKELKEDEIKEFNSSLTTLGDDLAKISDDDFSNLQISQEYPKEDFIKDVFDIVKDLSASERQKVYDYFGFELHKNSSGVQVDDNPKHSFSIIGYPVNLNNGKKLAKIEDSATKEIVEKLRPYVIRYSENNKISVNSSKEVEEVLNKIVEYLPEFRTAIDKAQHGAHDYAIANHSLKVMQKIVQNPEFEQLNESDKKLMLLSALLHDLSKAEGKKDVLHANNCAFDAYYISKKFNLTRDEEIKLYSLIRHHEWLGYVNAKDLTDEEKLKRQQSVAFDLQYDNLFDMSKIFTKADLESVKKDNEFYDKFKNEFEANSSKIDSLISELKTSQPLFPVTKIPSSSTINKAITTVNPDGSTNLKGIYKDENGLVIIRFNEVENSTWEKIGFDKGTISKGITTTTSGGDEVNTGNIHFFVHGLDFENQLSKFDAFSIPDSDALLSVSYTERPESKTRFFRPQGVILNTETKYTYGGGETDSGSGCGKDIDNFKNYYVFGGSRERDRKYISDLIKTTLKLDDKEYLDFVQQNKNKSFNEIEPVEVREKLIKAFAGINSNTRNGNRAYNEMYISNPNVMGVFAYPSNKDNKIGDTMEFVKEQKEFLKKYALEHDMPMIVFGE